MTAPAYSFCVSVTSMTWPANMTCAEQPTSTGLSVASVTGGCCFNPRDLALSYAVSASITNRRRRIVKPIPHYIPDNAISTRDAINDVNARWDEPDSEIIHTALTSLFGIVGQLESEVLVVPDESIDSGSGRRSATEFQTE